ncbi:heterokaryon incompatibility protein-domain-containing protein [Xylaria palmicola]|nr:heterokaryon incompatibility protein-domain-containing protein [Xylaria palmicola]
MALNVLAPLDSSTESLDFANPDEAFQAFTVKWIGCCESRHKACRLHRRLDTTMRLIDCETREVVDVATFLPDSIPNYIALSYVWGKTEAVTKLAKGTSTLPTQLTPVVEDAIVVTKALEYRYLWVDKFCVDQHDSTKKHQQIMHMDSVYQNAALTIIAAAGRDERYGLPGVSITRPIQQACFEGDGWTVASTLPPPHKRIYGSHWATRGWTYQEAVLSHRCLVFAEDQLYFECNTMSCYESLRISFSKYYSRKSTLLDHLLQPRLFSSLHQSLLPGQRHQRTIRLARFFTYVQCAEQYSYRQLSFDDDSLNAFGGIIRKLETVDEYPVRHIWGIPFLHPADYPSEQSLDFLGFIMTGLSWRHTPSTRPPRRRKNLPSWTWAGWEGAISWPKAAAETDIQGLDRYYWTNPGGIPNDAPSRQSASWHDVIIQLEDQDKGKHSFPDLRLRQMTVSGDAADSRRQFPKSLLIKTSAVPRAAFASVDRASSSKNTIKLSTGAEARFYPSKFGLSAARAVKLLKSGEYEAIRLGIVGDEATLMLIKWHQKSAYRVGVIVADHHQLNFADFNTGVKTYKLK